MLISSSAANAESVFRSLVLLAADAQVLDQIPERNDLRDIQRALDFVQHYQALHLHGFSEIDHGVRAGAAPDIVRIHRRMQRMQL